MSMSITEAEKKALEFVKERRTADVYYISSCRLSDDGWVVKGSIYSETERGSKADGFEIEYDKNGKVISYEFTSGDPYFIKKV